MRSMLTRGPGRTRAAAITGILAVLAGFTLTAMGTALADDEPLATTEPTTEVTEPAAPEVTDPAPEVTDPGPEATDPAPEATDPAPEATDPAPEVTDEETPPAANEVAPEEDVAPAVQPEDPGSDGVGANANAGDVKIHDITEPTNQDSNNPKPCNPVLVSFNFAVNEQYTYRWMGGVAFNTVIVPAHTVTVTTDPQQEPPAGDFNPPLVDGESYKLEWEFGATIGGTGFKQKVIQIDCPDPPEPGNGQVRVQKLTTGDAPDTTWTITVTCTTAATPNTVTFTLAEVGSIKTLDVPLTEGANSCTISETDNGTPDPTSVVYNPPANPVDLTQSDEQAVSETLPGPLFQVTNSYPEVQGEVTVSLSVEKEIQGTVPTTGSFTVHVTCTGDATFDGDLTFTIPNLGAQAVALQPDANIPSDGSVKCTITETSGGVLVGYKVNGGSLQGSVADLELNGDVKAWTVTVVNDPVETVVGGIIASRGTLPFTGGGPGWPLPVGAVLVLVGASLLLINKQRRTPSLEG